MLHSLSSKFLIYTVLLVTVILSITGVYNYISVKNRLNQELNSQLDLVEGRLQNSLPQLIWDFQNDLIYSVIESEVKGISIFGILVTDNNSVIEGLVKQSDGQLISVTEVKFSGAIRSIELMVNDGDIQEKLGTAKIYIDKSYISNLLKENIKRQAMQVLLIDLALIISLTLLLRNIVIQPIQNVALALEQIANEGGDLTKRIEFSSNNEIYRLVNSFNIFTEKIQNLVREVKSSSVMVDSSTTEVKGSTSEVFKLAADQQNEMESVSVSMIHLSTFSTEINEIVSSAADSAQQVKDEADTVRNLVLSTIDSIDNLSEKIQDGSLVMNALKKDVESIVVVLDVIKSIAEQTNLLALNAAIEAARAGDQGRGFAVVADEVRALAGRTQQSTQEIEEMIERLQAGTIKAVDVMDIGKESSERTVKEANETGASIDAIVGSISHINSLNSKIFSVSNEQASITNEITNSIKRISELSENATEATQRSAEVSESLAKQGTELKHLVAHYRTD